MQRSMMALLICVLMTNVFTGSNAASDQKADQKEQLRAVFSDLEAMYKPTKTGIDGTRITEPGTILVAKQEGLGMLPTDKDNPIAYKVVAGKINAPKGFWAAMLSSGETSTKILKPGERVYVTNMRLSQNLVRLTLLTCDMASVTVNGTTQQTRYKGYVEFELPAGESGPMTAAMVKGVIDPILALESEAAAPKTIELGQTTEQVEAMLGKPDKILKAGPKTIYVYKDVKVVLMDGKVTDVQ